MKIRKMATLIMALLMSSICMFTGCDSTTDSTSDSSTTNVTNSESSTTVSEEYDLTLTDYIYHLDDEETVALNYVFNKDGKVGDASLLTFKSNKENVATVNGDGIVTGVATGKAEITISIGDTSVTATVFVTTRVQKVNLSESKMYMFVGENQQLTAVAYNGKEVDANAVLAWESADNSIVSVDGNGVMTANGIGETKVTVSYGEQTDKVLVSVLLGATAENVNAFDETYINIYGRNYIKSDALCLDYVGGGVEVGIIGTSLTVDMKGSGELYVRVYVDNDKEGERMLIPAAGGKITVAKNLSAGQHKIRIVNTSERSLKIFSMEAEKFYAVAEKADFKIEFIGDSITAGYGVWGPNYEGWSLSNSDGSNTYAYHAGAALGGNFSMVASSGICVTNTNSHFTVNMETLYAEAVSNSEYTPDVVVLNLGTNDAARDPDFATNYQRFVQMLRAKYPDAYIICLYGMMGQADNIVSGIQQTMENLKDPKIVFNPIEIIPNTQAADGHPSAAAQKEWGQALAKYIKTLIA